MRLQIVAEHFELTPSLRDHVNASMTSLKDLLTEDTPLRVFLSVLPERDFRVLCRLHLRGRDVIVDTVAGDMYAAITRAGHRLSKSVFEARRKRKEARRSA